VPYLMSTPISTASAPNPRECSVPSPESIASTLPSAMPLTHHRRSTLAQDRTRIDNIRAYNQMHQKEGKHSGSGAAAVSAVRLRPHMASHQRVGKRCRCPFLLLIGVACVSLLQKPAWFSTRRRRPTAASGSASTCTTSKPCWPRDG
jgi:hypothetical protein